MTPIDLPLEVLATLREFRTCEFTTLSKNGSPVTWPLAARYQPDEGRFVLTTSIGLPQKAFNIRRNPRVSLLFSDPTASGLDEPAAVLVQADAEAPDQIVTKMEGLEDYWRENIISRQPVSKMYSTNPLIRYFMDWYYMRIVIYARPRRISWWSKGNMHLAPQVKELSYVA
jgi:general stress protein 26